MFVKSVPYYKECSELSGFLLGAKILQSPVNLPASGANPDVTTTNWTSLLHGP